MSERRLEYMPLSALVPNPANPKDHDVPRIDASMKRFDFTEPFFLDERTGKLAAGHGRELALQARQTAQKEPPAGVVVGDDGEWLVPVVRGWSSKDDAEARAYLVASNRLTEIGGWDPDLLLDAIRGEPDLSSIGWDDRALQVFVRQQEAIRQATVDVDDEWVGMPEFASKDLNSAAKVTIHFPTEKDADDFFKLIERQRAFVMWWPRDDGHVGSSRTGSEVYVSDAT